MEKWVMQINNEPVAWMQVHYEDGKPTKFSKVQTWEDDIPLYTHPANLTDEEIWKLWQKHLSDDIPVFARAILKKASEK